MSWVCEHDFGDLPVLGNQRRPVLLGNASSDTLDTLLRNILRVETQARVGIQRRVPIERYPQAVSRVWSSSAGLEQRRPAVKLRGRARSFRKRNLGFRKWDS